MKPFFKGVLKVFPEFSFFSLSLRFFLAFASISTVKNEKIQALVNLYVFLTQNFECTFFWHPLQQPNSFLMNFRSFPMLVLTCSLGLCQPRDVFPKSYYVLSSDIQSFSVCLLMLLLSLHWGPFA